VLIRFEVSNFRSILDPVELSMVAVDRDRDVTRPVENLGESLLPVAAIYGPNASGKSNVVAALVWLRDAVADSLRLWEDEIPVEPFAFGDGRDRPSVFVIELVIKDVRFEYVLEVDHNSVQYEGLFHYPEKKRRRIFEREGAGLKLQRGRGGLSGTRELLTGRTLALSAARRFDESLVRDFTQKLFSMQTIGFGPVSRRRASVPATSTVRWFDFEQQVLPGLEDFGGSEERKRVQALALLRMADLGIDDVVIDQFPVAFNGTDGESLRRGRRVRLRHRAGSESVPLDFAAESDGTRTWFNLLGPVLAAIRDGSPLFCDELDSNLHPTLSMHLIRLFHDPLTNPRGAQLIFTAHDTSLLNHLNRDEVWLTEKNQDGVTRLGALAEFAGERVRKSQNLENAYLHGRFGALPNVDRTEVLRALGLIG
jgi:predicted ATPase